MHDNYKKISWHKKNVVVIYSQTKSKCNEQNKIVRTPHTVQRVIGWCEITYGSYDYPLRAVYWIPDGWVSTTGFHRYMEAYFCNKDYGDESEWSHVVAIKVVTRKLKAFVFSDKDEGFF